MLLKTLKNIVITTSLYFPSQALACYVPTGDLAHNHLELISSTPTIILAKAISVEDINDSKEIPTVEYKNFSEIITNKTSKSRVQNLTNHSNQLATAKYTFETITTFKGDIKNSWTIPGENIYKNPSSHWATTFNDHSSSGFWKGKNGRLGNIGDCVTTSPPTFIIGKNYLLLIDGIDDSKRAENIESKEDNWLEFVKNNTVLHYSHN